MNIINDNKIRKKLSWLPQDFRCSPKGLLISLERLCESGVPINAAALRYITDKLEDQVMELLLTKEKYDEEHKK